MIHNLLANRTIAFDNTIRPKHMSIPAKPSDPNALFRNPYIQYIAKSVFHYIEIVPFFYVILVMKSLKIKFYHFLPLVENFIIRNVSLAAEMSIAVCR